MNGETLLESLQDVEDVLLEEAEAPVSGSGRRRRWGALAACAAVLVCGGLLLRGTLGQGTLPPSGVTALPVSLSIPEPTGYVNLPNVQITASPGAARPGTTVVTPTPGGREATPGDMEPAEPEVFCWVENVPMPYPGADDAGGVILVGRELTEEEYATCAPAQREEWMENFTGSAIYRLADGSGGLNGVELSVTHADLGTTCHITLRKATPERLAAFGLDRDNLPLIDGECYAACREYYDRGDGERVSILVAFVREDVLYTLYTDVPAEEKNAAAMDLYRLFLGYVNAPIAPDLDSFVYRK